ncbi:MAG: epoxyqueuosine reductase QueH [Lachnospiraceae bacterium]|nr:epoxyqueuosine reductase QueH [Lachnospiraceae bacterium]
MNSIKINYQKELDKTLEELGKKGEIPSLLLHGCCAPCSSYVLEYLSSRFHITMLFYNPNIGEASEYEKRRTELLRLIDSMPFRYPVSYLDCEYDPKAFYTAVPGRAGDREGGESCFQCYRLRLRRTAQEAVKGGFDYFTTTLSISPLKNAQKLNEIGRELSEEYGIPYLYSDFKKKNGYKRSIELSAEYGLYRQNFCGCAFSRREAAMREHQ